MTNKLDLAKKLLAVFKEAMPHYDAICDTVSDWVAGEDPPPLLRCSYTWSEAVVPEEFDQFRGLLHFLNEAIFGVDCDNDSAVKIVLVDKARDMRRFGFAIPRIPREGSTLKDIMTALQRARSGTKIAQGIVEEVERELEFFLEDNAHLLEAKSE